MLLTVKKISLLQLTNVCNFLFKVIWIKGEIIIKISLKAARINSNYKLQEIADELCVSKYTIMNWEKGKTKIPYAALDMLCRFYDCKVENII